MYIDRIFNREFAGFDFFEDLFKSFTSEFAGSEYPHIQVFEDEGELEIRAVAPGINPEDIDIELENQVLRIKGEKRTDYGDNSYLRKEISYGKFEKRVKLPWKIDPESINAELKNGILTIRLVKSEDAGLKKIEVK